MGVEYPEEPPPERMVAIHRPEVLRKSAGQFVQRRAPLQPARIQADLDQPVHFQLDIDQPVIPRRDAEALVVGQGALDPRVPGQRVFVRQLHDAPLEPGRFFPRSRMPQAQAGNLIPIGRYRLEFTVNAERFVYFILSLTTNTSSFVTGVVFWVATVFCIGTCFTSQVPRRVFNELIQRYIAGYPPNGSIWGHMFPATESNDAYQLRLAVQIPGYPHSRMIYSPSIPLLLHNPVFWLILMVCMWVSHHLSRFAHEFLRIAHERLEQQTET